MTVTYMARQKREVTTKSIRFIAEISEALEKYADDQLISVNSAVNKLLKDRLTELEYFHSQENKKSN